MLLVLSSAFAGWALAVGNSVLALLAVLPWLVLLWRSAAGNRRAVALLPFAVMLPSFLPGLPLASVVWVVLAVAVLGGSGVSMRSVPRLVSVPLAAFLVYAIATWLFGPSQFGMTVMVVVTFSLPLPLILAWLRNDGDLYLFLEGVARVGLLLGLLTIFEGLSGSYLFSAALRGHEVGERFGQLRAQVLTPHPIALGLILSLYAVLTVSLVSTGQRRFAVHAGVMVVGVYLTYSRAPLVLLGVAVPVFMVLATRANTARRWFRSVSFALVLLTIPQTRRAFFQLFNSLFASDATAETGRAIQVRLVTNETMVDFILRHPWGVGFFGLSRLRIVSDLDGFPLNVARSVDNSYLLAYSELGWLGGSLFLILLLSVTIRALVVAWRNRGLALYGPVMSAVAGSLTGFLIAIFTVASVTTWAQMSIAYWITVAVGIAAERLARAEQMERRSRAHLLARRARTADQHSALGSNWLRPVSPHI